MTILGLPDGISVPIPWTALQGPCPTPRARPAPVPDAIIPPLCRGEREKASDDPFRVTPQPESANHRVRLDGKDVPRKRHPAIRAKTDRKSTRLNSSHLVISYAVYCL